MTHQTSAPENEPSNLVLPVVEFLPMSHRLEIRDGNEDWTGKTSSALRRKLQNRLNQRAARMCTPAPIFH